MAFGEACCGKGACQFAIDQLVHLGISVDVDGSLRCIFHPISHLSGVIYPPVDFSMPSFPVNRQPGKFCIEVEYHRQNT